MLRIVSFAARWPLVGVVVLLLLSIIWSACDDSLNPTPVQETISTFLPTNVLLAGAMACPPILFVHGNGDSAALWLTTLWRFESANYPRERLFTIDFTNPTARDDDRKPQEYRSSTEDQRLELSERVHQILDQTGETKVALVGNSRGGNAIRNFIKQGGANKVSHAILAGTPNHGIVYARWLARGNEFNGAGYFLKSLNADSEIVEEVQFMTIRSDKGDKFAQPRSMLNPIAVGYAGPELKGANNIVLESLDHREVAYHRDSFRVMHEFITGSQPHTCNINVEDQPQLSGLITGFEKGVPTNKPVADIRVSIFELDSNSGARLGQPVHQTITSQDGSWGILNGKPTAYYEFVVEASGQPARHFFRSPFPRSNFSINMSLADEIAIPGKSVIFYTRPRGYIAGGRDVHSFDGQPLPGVRRGVPTVSSYRIELGGIERGIPVGLNGENMIIRSVPNAVVYAEFHY